jgi:hypothetical protein
MKKMSLNGYLVVFIFLLTVFLPLSSYSETHRFNHPKISGIALDWCLTWAANCGKPAADEFCRSQGFQQASDFKQAVNIGYTKILRTGEICNNPQCDGFAYIECIKVLNDDEKAFSFNGKWYLSGGANYWKMVLEQNGNKVWGNIHTKDVYGSEVIVGKVDASIVSADRLALKGTWYWDYDPNRKIKGLGENHSIDRLELFLQPTKSERIIIRGLRIDPHHKVRMQGSNERGRY